MEYELDPYRPEDKKDKKVRKKAIKKNAIKFTKIVSLVGVRHATDSRNSSFRRIVWMVWLVFGVAFAIYQTEECIERYFKYPALTEMRIVTEHEEIQFPQVTICCDNQIMSSKARDKGVFKDIAYIENTMQRIRVYDERPYYTNAAYYRNIAMKQLGEHIENLNNLTHDWETLSKELAPKTTEAVVKVEFNDTSFNESNIKNVVTDLGHCYAFGTKDEPLYTTKQGPLNGLSIILHSKSLEIIPSVRFLANQDSLPGFKVLVHDPLDVPRLRDSGFSVRRGKIVRVMLSFENVTQQGPPYGSCNDTDMNYRASECIARCEYQQFVRKCGCKDIHMDTTELKDVQFCSLGQTINCSRLNDSREEGKETTCSCPHQCHRREYKTDISQSKMSIVLDQETQNRLAGGSTDDTMKLEIYYPLMSYFEARGVPAYSYSKLLCDIGNALSLLLGATLLTIYESLEFIFLFLIDYSRFRLTK